MAYTTETDTVTLESMVGPLMLDCPEPIVMQALRWAAIEFCERTRLWANTQTVTTSLSVAPLMPLDDATITDVQDVRWSGKSLTPVSQREAADLLQATPTGTPSVYFRPDLETLTMAAAPDASGTLSVTMILAPTRTAKSIPVFLHAQHLDAIEAGARYRLMRMTNRPWFDPLWSDFRAQFEGLVGSYSIRADKDGTRRPLRSTLNF